MYTVYCELHEYSAKKLKLPRYVHYTSQKPMNRGNHIFLAYSDRVWVQHETFVKFEKHRWADTKTTKVDLEEFMWIKLKSKSI